MIIRALFAGLAATAALTLSLHTNPVLGSFESAIAAQADQSTGRIVSIDSPTVQSTNSSSPNKQHIESEGGPGWDQFTAANRSSKQHIESEGGPGWDQYSSQQKPKQ